jgi:hypothetical protein
MTISLCGDRFWFPVYRGRAALSQLVNRFLAVSYARQTMKLCPQCTTGLTQFLIKPETASKVGEGRQGWVSPARP